MASPESAETLLETPLAAWHVAQGAKMVPFAGYNMPVHYPLGIMGEHNWTRDSAGLFDVSHMGQCFLIPEDGKFETAAAALEKLVPTDVLSLKPGQQRYSQFLNAEGGILDDLMITRLGQPGHEHWIYLVVNAGCKVEDYRHLAAHLPRGVTLKIGDNLALLALQGPKAAAVIARHAPALAELKFMTSTDLPVAGLWCHVSRTGYTGEDGLEISVKNADVEALASLLLKDERVKPIGLGARDSLRLEAGLCLYGHDIDATTSPIEADLKWSIQKRRREEGGFPGAARIRRELANGPARLRVGIRPEGRQPAREGTEIFAGGRRIGVITSGGFGPTAQAPVAMGYVETAFAKPDTPVVLAVRGKELPARIAAMPFAPHRYFR
ncbi:MAG: glycine cleavage system aminomethyltransferase GcvT [Methylobacterium sp.]|nr:glycine cleavage system aminomethyltransferase GcvT [Methylobacterium sp.]MCA3651332.1 glycine cleavage system aminomethyltransferase GcvT [Methylobacterium sp.]MCA4922671.1 glycine cleavage system aminomethyltransferase GcvT [Methylobacterium sp.]